MEHLARPYDDLTEASDKQKWMMEQYPALMAVGDDGVEFAGKTSFMIAYERQVESEKAEGVRLFNDHLAKHFTSGDVGKAVSDCMSVGLKAMFDPTDEVGLGYDGHNWFTGARTALINDRMNTWLEETEGVKQVVNIGAGVDTRPFWMDTLKKA